MSEAKRFGRRQYYVDEAGDGNVFNRKGRALVGTPGCSRFFMLGFLDVLDSQSLAAELEKLRAKLLADPYFKGVPSMQPESKKTALGFHAKDDLPEVRKEVFDLLKNRPDLRFFAVVKDKFKVLEYALQRKQGDPGYNYHPNELYDFLTRRIFKQHLHKADHYQIFFAMRGNKPRNHVLRQSIEIAQQRFMTQYKVQDTATLEVVPSKSHQVTCLQATDYFLWALQRFYERSEDRYLELLWPSFRLVQGLDDTRNKGYGEYYYKNRPLTLAALNRVTEK